MKMLFDSFRRPATACITMYYKPLGFGEVIKLSEKKEMLAATITDNDRIGPSFSAKAVGRVLY